MDSSNNVYVVDRLNDRVVKFAGSGSYLTQWGGYGTGRGQFNYPEGIAVDRSNNVYVADPNNSRVEKFDSNGNYLTQWGSPGSGDGQFEYPVGIAVDSSNNVYVVDGFYVVYGYRVEKFTSNGTYLAQWGGEGSGKGQFNYPEGIAVDSSGNFIYVADAGNHRIQVFVNNTNIVPPIIINQPVSQTVPAGINATLSVGLVGTAPFSYQWNSNNVAVPGATNAIFTLTNVSLTASGSAYSVLVTNSFGSELSGSAVLAVVPILVTTQPASGLSATGAVLNGSVTVGVESLAWFEWGTDTNYGNITGATIVPGKNGSNNISASLNGLPGNYYHYRMDAANDFGIVYGEDQSFTVGFAPSATTLFAINNTAGATLQAAVNPEGWDTTVYFQWVTPTLTNTTTGINIGAGATLLNVSSFVPGLAPSTPYQYQVVASNALGTAVGKVAYGHGEQLRYLFSGTETTITLPPGTYIITAYGAPGGGGSVYPGGVGAEMSAEFYFPASTTITLLVGGGGESAGGGGGSFVVARSTPLVIAGGGGGGAVFGSGGNGSTSGVAGGGGGTSGGATAGSGGGGFLGNGGGAEGGSSFENGGAAGGGGGFGGGGGAGTVYYGGGGSIIDSSAIANLAEVSGIASPDDPTNGEIIIIAVSTPLVITTHAAFGFTNGVFGFDVIGPPGSNAVIEASTDLQTWMPLQTNQLGSGPLYFSDSQSPANPRRFYRAQLMP